MIDELDHFFVDKAADAAPSPRTPSRRRPLGAAPRPPKRACVGARVHFNERGVPMWHCGYERCGVVREAFRVDAPALAAAAVLASAPDGDAAADDAADDDARLWPSRSFASAWVGLADACRAIADAALESTLTPAERTAAKDGGGVGGGDGGDAAPVRPVCVGDDLSVCYSLHYPNDDAEVDAAGDAAARVRGGVVWNVRRLRCSSLRARGN